MLLLPPLFDPHTCEVNAVVVLDYLPFSVQSIADLLSLFNEFQVGSRGPFHELNLFGIGKLDAIVVEDGTRHDTFTLAAVFLEFNKLSELGVHLGDVERFCYFRHVSPFLCQVSLDLLVVE